MSAILIFDLVTLVACFALMFIASKHYRNARDAWKEADTWAREIQATFDLANATVDARFLAGMIDCAEAVNGTPRQADPAWIDAFEKLTARVRTYRTPALAHGSKALAAYETVRKTVLDRAELWKATPSGPAH